VPLADGVERFAWVSPDHVTFLRTERNDQIEWTEIHFHGGSSTATSMPLEDAVRWLAGDDV
jgi:hypothetical protein